MGGIEWDGERGSWVGGCVDGGGGGVLGDLCMVGGGVVIPGVVVGGSIGGGRDRSVLSSRPGGGREGVGSVFGAATCIVLWLGGVLGCCCLVVALLLG